MAASEYIVSAANLRAMADAIREKTGQAGLITPNQMAAAIAAIPGGGGVEVEPLSVTENDVYTAPAGKAYSPVTVNVPSGKGYAKGTYTLASVAEKIEFNPGLSFTPRIFLIYAKTTDYTINGGAGALFIADIPITISGPSGDVNYAYNFLETRTTWGTNARIQPNLTVGSVNPVVSSSAASLPCRNGNYKWPGGEYEWEAWE